jgi:hypothetical protein
MSTTVILPVITTTTISAIASTTATSGGDITSDGGAAVTARGVCWNTSPGPTISNNKTTDGIGKGSFASSITGLTASTAYYIRSYATNSVGTAYGNELTLTTSPNLSIEWTEYNPGQVTSVYHYSGGVLVGESLYRNFSVIDGSGEIPITVQDVEDNITKTTVFSVEQGKNYTITLTMNFSNSGTGTCPYTLIFSSLNCSTTASTSLTSIPQRTTIYLPPPSSPIYITTYYCPASLIIGDISIGIAN